MLYRPVVSIRELRPLRLDAGPVSDLETAVAGVGALGREWRGLPIGLHIPRTDLLDRSGASSISERLGRTGRSASSVFLQIDAARAAAATVTVHRLAEAGFNLELVNVSDAHEVRDIVAELSLAALRISEQQIVTLGQDGPGREVVRGIVDVCAENGVSSVAAGVSDSWAFYVLRELGCDAAAGDLISPPRPPAELAGWLAELPRPR